LRAIADIAVAVALGGDCPADITLVRAEPDVYAPVAPDPISDF
jgi:hypothetical protein